jgi:hypothetical protein
MASIAGALSRIKQDPLGVIKPAVVEALCDEVGYDWRQRRLDPAATLALFVQQIIAGNTPCSEVRHLGQQTFSASAWCQARARLPLAVYQGMLTRVCDAALPQTHHKQYLWHGHRTFHVDGSTFSMPDTQPLRSAFGTARGANRCPFPVAHLLLLFNAATGLLLDAAAAPLYTSDVSAAAELHAHLHEGDILIGDDSFAGWAHVALLSQANLHALLPNHHMRIVDFTGGRPHSCLHGKKIIAGLPRSRWMRSLGADDQLVEWFKPPHTPAWMSQQQYDALPDSITVREVRRRVRLPEGRRITVTIITTLLDPLLYPADELIALQLRRWDVETNLRHLKTTMGLDVLRCKTEAGVRKELAVFCLVYNLVRVVMLQAANRQDVPVSRISFADALKWMRHARRGDVLPDLIVNPLRRGRLEPRCCKRRPKSYDLMNKPRSVLRKTLKTRGRGD